MIKRILVHIHDLFSIKSINIHKEYSDEVTQELLSTNIRREAMLSIILLSINIFLLCLDFIVSNAWTKETHVFIKYSLLHFLLLLVPLLFLLIVTIRGNNTGSKSIFHRVLHLLINTFVLIFCSLIAVNANLFNKLPFPYIIAMFCIASLMFLIPYERFLIFGLSYFVYIIGTISIHQDFHALLGNIIFVTLLNTLALVVSSINYKSFVNNFIYNKIILAKNVELDNMYKVTEGLLEKRTEEINELKEYEKLRTAFFANISHELRTPLTVIFSSQQMLDSIFKSSQINERQKDIDKYMRITKQNTFRLIRLIVNLIDVTKIDAGYFQINFEDCNIVKVIEDITLSVAKYIEDMSIILTFDTEIEEAVIACDPDKIERIMLNLLSNAVKFTHKGGHIYVNIYQDADMINISVKDTGIGIPANMKDSIFERFVQVDKTISRAKEGSGIGLSIVKSLVEMHNGNILLTSEQGKGSEFIIRIPNRKLSYQELYKENNFITEKQNIEKINIEFSDIYN